MDISKLTDEELMQIAGSSEQPATTPSTQTSFDSISDEELMSIAGITKPKSLLPGSDIPEVQNFESRDITDSGVGTTSVFDDKPGKSLVGEGKGIEGMQQGFEGMGRGAGRLPLGVAKLSGDAISYFGNEEYANKAKQWINQNEKYIEDNGLEGEALFGEIASSIALPSSFIKTGLAKISGAVGAEIAVTSLGSGDTYGEAALQGAAGAALTAGGGAIVGKVLEKLGPTSQGTNYLVNRIVAGMPEEEAIKKQDELIEFISSIPKDQQTYALANMAEGKMGLDNIKQAVKGDTELEAILNNSLRDRKQIVAAVTAGNSDVGAAQAKWSDMLKQVEEVAPAQFSTDSLKKSLDYVSNIYGMEGTSKASQLVRQIKADTSEPALSASQALNVRKGVNELIRKSPKGSREIIELEKIKSSLDNFIDTTLPPEVNQLVKDTTSEYARVINNKKFGDIIEKNTSQGIGVDWTKVLKDSKKEGLRSEEVIISTNIAKEFEKKFKYDKALASVATPSGIKDASGGLLFFLTMVSNKVRDVASPLFSRSRYENLKIQKEIVNTIKKRGTSFTETMTGLSSNQKIPDEFRLGVFKKLADRYSGKALGALGTGVVLQTQSANANTPRPANKDLKEYFASIESDGNYSALNKSSGAFGKYQIHPVMMKDLGITKEFLHKPENQEKVMDMLIPKYQSRLEKFDIPTTKENMFVLHNLGSTGGVRVLTGKYTTTDIKNMANQLPGDLKNGNPQEIVANYANRYNILIPRRAN